MCLILFANDTHPDFSLILAANRDEFYERPTAPAAFWEEAPLLLAGRDLQGGGTWLGMTRQGRIAALSNFREYPPSRLGAPSRGDLPLDFLRGEMPTDAYRELLRQTGKDYCGFNLLFGTPGRLACVSNRGSLPSLVPPGIHGLSNHLLNTPWPKVARGREALERLLAQGGEPDPEALFAILADRTIPPDHLLPDTGFGLEWERVLSPIFIESPAYGTRSSTVILVDRKNIVTFLERSVAQGAVVNQTVTFRFRIGD